jgi:hypothetical protein
MFRRTEATLGYPTCEISRLVPYFWLATDAPEALTSAFPFVDPPGGGSFWMRKR